MGTAERAPELLGGRADESPPATPALTDALSAAGLEQVHGVQIAATEVPVIGADVRGPHDEGLMLLQVPDLGAEAPQVLLQVDEAGVATWHFPQPATAMTPGTLEFSVPREVATAPIEGASDDRGLAAMIGRKLLSVLVFPALEAGVGLLARVLAEKYEKSSRPYRLRTFAPGETRTAGAGNLADRGWDGIDGRALLFVHGTFATSHGTFSGLADDVIGDLWHTYDGRVLAFDHPSLSVTPQQNAAELMSMIPPGRRLDVDIVSHSRGGLVARALADAAAAPDSPLQVRSTVFVAAPNAGTPLADDAHIKAFIDRMTTMLNLIPDGPLSLPADILGGVLDVVKIIAAGAVEGLPGLRAMDPTDPGLTTLGRLPARTSRATPSTSSSSRPAACCPWSGSRTRPSTWSSGRRPTTSWSRPTVPPGCRDPRSPRSSAWPSAAATRCGTAPSSPSNAPPTTCGNGAAQTSRDDPWT